MTAARRPHRHLPVVRWLQLGVVTAGAGAALVLAPGIAAADDGNPSSSASDTNSRKTERSAAQSDAGAGHRRGDVAQRIGRQPTGAATSVRVASGGPRPAATARGRASVTALVNASAAVATDYTAETRRALELQEPTVVQQPASESTPSTVSRQVAAEQSRSTTATVAANASAVAVGPFGQITAFLGLPGAPATSAPTVGAFPVLTRLTLEDLFSGTGPTPVVNPTAVVTGLFQQVLRTTPTAEELQNYLGVMALTGVNGVVAGLYSSTAFRQNQVENYYLQLLNRPATSQELALNTSALIWGRPEGLLAASIAGSNPFYDGSASGGGPLGPMPSSLSFVDNLYRTMLGTPADDAVAAGYLQQLNAGLPIGLAALQFVTAETYRQAKVRQVYEVLGETATQAQINAAVQDWFWAGGLTGITTSLLTAVANVDRIEAGPVDTPDMVAAAQLREVLLAAYTSTPDGFVETLNRLLGSDADNPCPTSPTCNTALFTLLTTGGGDRGLTNGGIDIQYGTANTADLIPTQNEINLFNSLRFKLEDPVGIAKDFAGGVIIPFGDNPVITANNGSYIVDGHHRWSGTYLINPFTQIYSVDIGYVPTPQTALKEAQVGVAAQLGYVKTTSAGEGINVYTVDRATFDETVNGWILGGPQVDAVLAVFRENLGIPDSATEAAQLTAIDNYLWSNVERMRNLNPFIPGATIRDVMPQAEPLTPILSLLGSGMLSYSFPVVSYLG
jgi:hypothetical protein